MSESPLSAREGASVLISLFIWPLCVESPQRLVQTSSQCLTYPEKCPCQRDLLRIGKRKEEMEKELKRDRE